MNKSIIVNIQKPGFSQKPGFLSFKAMCMIKDGFYYTGYNETDQVKFMQVILSVFFGYY